MSNPVWHECDLCGTDIPADPRSPDFPHPRVEVGEFWVEEKGDSVIAHASCGLEAELPIA